MTLLRIGLVLAALVVSAGTARADVIDPSAPPRVCPPMSCPPGSYGVGGGHSGCPYDCSAPTECDDTHPCSPGSVCEATPVSVCIERVNGGHYEFEALREACVDGACPTGQTCWTHRRCVPDPSVPVTAAATPTPAPAPSAPAAPAASESGGGCSAGPAGAPPTALMALVLALSVVRRARRR